MQAAWVQTMVRELDPVATTKGSHAMTKEECRRADRTASGPGAETASREEALKLSLALMAELVDVPCGMVGKLLGAVPGAQPSRE